MNVGECGNELRDWVIGFHLLEQGRLVCPAEGFLIACQLHPHRVYGVGWQHTYVCHYQVVVPIHHHRVGVEVAEQFFGLLAEEHERIALHHEVVVVGVVVFVVERDRVALALAVACEHAAMTIVAVARGECQQGCHHPNEVKYSPHKYSFDSVCNRTRA